MVGQHPKATQLAASGFFSGIQSFAELEQRLDAIEDEKARGDAFEVFASAWLALFYPAQPDAQHFWPLDAAVAARLNVDAWKDMGIDSVLQYSDALTTVQVKYRADRKDLSWSELATFFGLSERAEFRLVISNGYGIAETAVERGRTGFIGADFFDQLAAEDFVRIEEYLSGSGVRRIHQAPKEHQQEAISAALAVLQDQRRVRVIMACGTGKTLVQSCLARNYARVLVLVPSLALIRQHLLHWAHAGLLRDYSSLALCSDTSAGSLSQENEADISVDSLGISVSTTPQEVSEFLVCRSASKLVLFCTYQSAPVLAESLPVGFEFDFGAFDEAHRTAVRKSNRFALALHDESVPIGRRAFFTATPRNYLGTGADAVFSMDDASAYGPIAYELGLQEASERGLICDYKVIVSVVTQSMVDQALLAAGVVDIDGVERRAYDVACHLAIAKTMRKYGLKKGMAFFSRTEAARLFADPLAQAALYGDESPMLSYVDGRMRPAERARRLHAYSTAAQAVLANARCLTEGVDVPATDFVAFLAPRSSYVDIVQILGRALRLYDGKQFGYILLPVFVQEEAGEPIIAALTRTGLQDVWSVLQALREQDARVSEIASTYHAKTARKLKSSFSDFAGRLEIVADGLDVSLTALQDTIAVRALEGVNDSWEERLAQLQEFVDRNGHALVGPRTCSNPQLVNWVANCRHLGDSMSSDRRRKLDALGFVWDVKDQEFQDMLAKLKEYVATHGHPNVRSRDDKKSGIPLYQWIRDRRKAFRMGRLSQAHREALEQAGLVLDVPRPSGSEPRPKPTWELRYEQLREFVASNRRFPVLTEKPLGSWLGIQRKNREQLTPARVAALEAIGMDWAPHESSWTANFEAWKAMQACPDAAGPYPGWETLVRRRYADGKLTADQRRMLEEANFPLERLKASTQADEGHLAELRAFVAENGHARVSPAARPALARWISRMQKRWVDGMLHQDLAAVFEELQVPKVNLRVCSWEDKFTELLAFQAAHGHCDVPHRGGGYDKLSTWCFNQRTAWRAGELSEDRVRRLDALSFRWASARKASGASQAGPVARRSRQQRWAEHLVELRNFLTNNGRFPRHGDGHLCSWVVAQRRHRDRLTVQQVAALDALGFDWKPSKGRNPGARAAWRNRCDQVVAFKAAAGRFPYQAEGPLGHWVSVQRRSRAHLTEQQIAALDEVGFDWSPHETAWGSKYVELVAFKGAHGHLELPAADPGLQQLRAWVSTQRTLKRTGKLSAERMERLDAMGFKWIMREGELAGAVEVQSGDSVKWRQGEASEKKKAARRPRAAATARF